MQKGIAATGVADAGGSVAPNGGCGCDSVVRIPICFLYLSLSSDERKKKEKIEMISVYEQTD